MGIVVLQVSMQARKRDRVISTETQERNGNYKKKSQ